MPMSNELELDTSATSFDESLLNGFNALVFSAMVLGSTDPPPEHAITSIKNREPETRANFLNMEFLLYLIRKREKLEINSTNLV
jgi:hypothetical protein